MPEAIRSLYLRPGSLLAASILLFFATREVGGLGALRGLAEGLLVLFAVREAYKGVARWRSLIFNTVYLAGSLFVFSALAACLISPFPALSFEELRNPLLKNMLLVPLLFSLAIAGLLRHSWDVERIAVLLLVSLALSGVGQLIWLLVHFGRQLVESSTLPTDPYFFRNKVGGLLVTLPFVLLATRYLSRFWSLFMALAGLMLVVLILASNSRGAWLGMLAGGAYLVWVGAIWKKAEFRVGRLLLLALPILAALAVFLFFATPVGETFVARINQGFDTSNRFGAGVWGASLDLIRQRPWLGYGYGDAVYIEAYKELAASHPEWTVRETIGAHNSILAHWIAAGVFGLLAVLLLYAGFLRGSWRLLQRYRDVPSAVDLLQASTAAMLSLYLVRGQFETIRWDFYGILMAAIIWLFAAQPGSSQGPDDGVSRKLCRAD